MLDAVLDYLPSPLDVPSVEGGDPRDEEKRITRKPDVNEPFAALAFKIVTRPILRQSDLLPGLLRQGRWRFRCYQLSQGTKERIGKLFQMHANNGKPG